MVRLVLVGLAAWFGLFGLCCHIVAPLKELLVSLTWLGMEPTASRFPPPPPPGRSDGAYRAGAAPKRRTRHSAALLVNPCVCGTGGWNRFTETAASLLVFPAANQHRALARLASSHSWSSFAVQVQMKSLPVLTAAWWAVGSLLAATFVFLCLSRHCRSGRHAGVFWLLRPGPSSSEEV